MECKEKNWGSVCTYQIFPIDQAVVQGARKQLTSGFFYKRRENARNGKLAGKGGHDRRWLVTLLKAYRTGR
jgi:hypothetical protein